MSRALALRQASTAKARHAAAFKAEADRKEAARRQWEWDHFEPEVHGSPGPNMSIEEINRIIDGARERKQNVFFGGGWMAQDQSLAATEPQSGTTAVFWGSVAITVVLLIALMAAFSNHA